MLRVWYFFLAKSVRLWKLSSQTELGFATRTGRARVKQASQWPPQNPLRASSSPQRPASGLVQTRSSRKSSWGTILLLVVPSLTDKTPLIKGTVKNPLTGKTTGCSITSPDKWANHHSWCLWPGCRHSRHWKQSPSSRTRWQVSSLCLTHVRGRSAQPASENSLTLQGGKPSFVSKFPLSVVNRMVKTESHEIIFCQH